MKKQNAQFSYIKAIIHGTLELLKKDIIEVYITE
jgi:hypothetical protein